MPTASFALLEDPPRVRELDRLGDEIAELSAHLDAATARLLALIRDFDARGGWNTGFRSCAEWLSWRVGLDLGAARERVRVAHALGALPRLAEALARGELSYAKVRALTRVATPETEARPPAQSCASLTALPWIRVAPGCSFATSATTAFAKSIWQPASSRRSAARGRNNPRRMARG